MGRGMRNDDAEAWGDNGQRVRSDSRPHVIIDSKGGKALDEAIGKRHQDLASDSQNEDSLKAAMV
jgi:hypothetical protein